MEQQRLGLVVTVAENETVAKCDLTEAQTKNKNKLQSELLWENCVAM